MTSEQIADGDILEAIIGSFSGAMPEVFFVGIVASVVLMAIYLNSESVVLTGITAMLSGGIIVEYLPAEVQMMGYFLILAAVSAVGVSLYVGSGGDF